MSFFGGCGKTENLSERSKPPESQQFSLSLRGIRTCRLREVFSLRGMGTYLRRVTFAPRGEKVTTKARSKGRLHKGRPRWIPPVLNRGGCGFVQGGSEGPATAAAAATLPESDSLRRLKFSHCDILPKIPPSLISGDWGHKVEPAVFRSCRSLPVRGRTTVYHNRNVP